MHPQAMGLVVAGHDLERGIAGRQGLLEAPARRSRSPRRVWSLASTGVAGVLVRGSPRPGRRSAAARWAGAGSSRAMLTPARPR